MFIKHESKRRTIKQLKQVVAVVVFYCLQKTHRILKTTYYVNDGAWVQYANVMNNICKTQLYVQQHNTGFNSLKEINITIHVSNMQQSKDISDQDVY